MVGIIFLGRDCRADNTLSVVVGGKEGSADPLGSCWENDMGARPRQIHMEMNDKTKLAGDIKQKW